MPTEKDIRVSGASGSTRAPRKAVKLTKRSVESLPAGEPKGTRYFDTELRGFGVKVYASGEKIFFIMYGDRKARRSKRIGRYGHLTVEQARAVAKKELGDYVSTGVDPLEKKRERDAIPTFGEWVMVYLTYIQDRKKSVREDRRYLALATERWQRRKVTEITRDDVTTEMKRIQERAGGKNVIDGHTTANRWLASVRACLEEAWRRGKVPRNVAEKVSQFPENPPRTRILTEEEYGRVLDAIEALPDLFVRAAFLLLILTGCRKSEILNAKWTDIDLMSDKPHWTIPSPKNGRPDSIPLTPGVRAILEGLPRNGAYVIQGKDPDKARSDLNFLWRRLRKVADIPDVRIHDIRRTYGNSAVEEFGIHVGSKLLRHSNVGVTARVYAPLGNKSLTEKATQIEEANARKRKNGEANR